jgi:CheY-like chemotaxis protein
MPAAEPGESHAARVVLVDDLEEMRALLKEMLRQQGSHVVGEASDGREALQVLAGARADVVVMDHHMPGMNGLEATARVHATWPHLRIAAFTGDADPTVIAAMLDAGADAHFHKGDLEGLLAYVAAAPASRR